MNTQPGLVEQGIVKTAIQEYGVDIALELVVYKPHGVGPFPVIVFNHGSTGSGRSQKIIKQTTAPVPVADYFNRLGWMVVYPQRRGRGKSSGRYSEGFEGIQGGYSCVPEYSLAGLDRACEDLEAVMNHLAERDDVISNRVVLAGVSRGGALAIAYAGMRPEQFIAVINFSGGWLGRLCARTYKKVNQQAFLRGAGFSKPTLWLYGKTDSYYGIPHCQDNFDAYVAGGGVGKFHALPAGHNLLFKPRLWEPIVSLFLDTASKLPVNRGND